jgi:hypothetical protein
MATGPGRKNIDDALLLALASGASITVAAQQAHCSDRTVRRRLQDPDFRSRVSAMRSEMVEKAIGRLAAMGTRAADELYNLLGSADERNRLAACRTILTTMLAGHEHELLAGQVAELQWQMQQLKEEMKNGPAANPPRACRPA